MTDQTNNCSPSPGVAAITTLDTSESGAYDQNMVSEHVLEISGSLDFRERIELPPGAVATVKLVDASKEVLAATAFETSVVPARFTLYADPADVEEALQLKVWAVLRSAVGVWGTIDLVSAWGSPLEIVLPRIDQVD